MSEVTRILDAAQAGDPAAADQLLPLVYDELRRLAAIKMADQSAGHTLQPTALVHEAYVRLVGSEDKRWQNSRHFFAAAAEAMRHILVDWARRKGRLKRGGEWQRLDLDSLELAAEALLAVHEALEAFSRYDAEKAELVKLRFFGGLTLICVWLSRLGRTRGSAVCRNFLTGNGPSAPPASICAASSGTIGNASLTPTFSPSKAIWPGLAAWRSVRTAHASPRSARTPR